MATTAAHPAAHPDFDVLDVPRALPPEPGTYLRAAMAWHFGPDTGSTFWLSIAGELDFDPIADVRDNEDLRRFPNVVDRLRDVAVEDLVPRGYRDDGGPVPRIFESGGTTGSPKRTAQLPDWVEQVTRWQVEDFAAGGFVRGSGLLCLMPGGPHGVGHFDRAVAERLGAACHAVDLDPRWAKRLAAAGDRAGVAAYVAHVLEQARDVLTTQRVANLHTTPPLLEALARDDELVALVAERVRYLLLSGAHVDADTLDLLAALFPDTAIALAYGSTMILSQAATRTVDGVSVFDPRSPYVTFWVVDPEDRRPVGYGERGQVITNHVSKGMFLPNNLERDTAVRVPGPPGSLGDSLRDVAPVDVFDGEAVVEGVY